MWVCLWLLLLVSLRTRIVSAEMCVLRWLRGDTLCYALSECLLAFRQAWKSEFAEKHYCILFYMSLVGSVGIVGMDDLFESVGLVHLFGLVNLLAS